ncbi:hypothetical protein EXIGLDRAFT_838694 [Exidia glandulosa HHB12029]|uniref:Uncharacterized protein n=1 Tax=Exidia glandulosa HHB12029 TaxID=1314781 RepID=A0A165FKD3_EXIGL|nr:hypothetical protein EXIGLDRAFT_838694 [Exidia glandulosa HHB12029]
MHPSPHKALFYCALWFLSDVCGRNVSIDDTVGDEITGVAPIYSVAGDARSWHARPADPCSICWANPDQGLARNNTWHDGTNSGNGSSSISFNFTGTAIYIYAILANVESQAPVQTHLLFYSDGRLIGQFDHNSTASEPTYTYDYPVYVNTSLGSQQERAFEIVNGNNNTGTWSIILFDYAIYTTSDELDQTDTQPSPLTGIDNVPSVTCSASQAVLTTTLTQTITVTSFIDGPPSISTSVTSSEMSTSTTIHREQSHPTSIGVDTITIATDSQRSDGSENSSSTPSILSTSSGPSPSSTTPRSTSLGSTVTSSPTPSDPASSTQTATASSRSSATPTTSPPGGTDGLIGTSFNPASPIPSVTTSSGTNLTPSSSTSAISALTSLGLPVPSVVHVGVTISGSHGNFSSAAESTRTSAVFQSAGTPATVDHGADPGSGADTKNVSETDGNGSASTGMGASSSANSINDLGGHCSCGNTPRKTATIITTTTITTTVVVAAASFAITVVLRRRRRQRRRAKNTARRGSLGHRVEPTAERGPALVLYTPVQTHEQEGETESRSVEGPSVPLLGV